MAPIDHDRQTQLLHRYIEATIREYDGPIRAAEVSNILKALTCATAYFARQARADPRQVMEQSQLVLEDALNISEAEIRELTETVWRRIRRTVFR